jgi:minichromosome maintenance protein 10
MDAEDEDEDEETLQLQLQEIQARLKLKKLKKKAAQTSITEKESERAGSAPLSRAGSAAASRAQSRIAHLREERLKRSKSQTNMQAVHVPVSPTRRMQPTVLPRSPQRVLLGIDKGLKGSDVSLKRAPSFRKPEDEASPKTNLLGPFLQRTASQTNVRVSGYTNTSQEDRPLSFNERMAAMKKQDKDSQERDLRIRKNRSMAFDIDHAKMQNLKETAVEYSDVPRQTPEFSREEVLQSYNKPCGDLPRKITAPSAQSVMRNISNSTDMSSASARSASTKTDDIAKRRTAKLHKDPRELTDAEASEFEPYSSVHLSKRIIPHRDLTRTLTGKKTFVIPDLLRTVKAPDFSGPDIEEDVVVFGIIASKSEPRSHAQNSKNDKRGKYMVMHLTDLKWELDLFLFDSAFERLWKLTVGTVIAILNPNFMQPRPGQADTGKWSLLLNSNADTVLEIGTARDLGFCKTIKKDGKTCTTWIDKRHTEFCEYHVNETLRKTHANRMEVNTMNFGYGSNGKKRFNSRDLTGHFEHQKKIEEEKKTRYDRESHSQIFIGRSTANMLDDTDFDPDAFHRGSTKEERMTRRILEQEKERQLRKKLGGIGTGLGADYMRRQELSQQLDLSTENQTEEPPPDAASLGLLDGKARDVQLSPIKRKRSHTTSNSSAVGWGGNLTKELGRMKNGESLKPIKKKTRFVTEKGIREAGRESIGGDAVKAVTRTLDDDDDDDLEILRD